MKHFAIASILCLSAAASFAQCKSEHVNTREEMHKASAVVVGTVTAAEPVPAAWDFLDGVNYTVHIDAKIHGKAQANSDVTVFSENSPRFFAMYVGQQYVLYLQPQWGRNQVDNCGNSHAMTENTAASTTSTKLPKITAARGF